MIILFVIWSAYFVYVLIRFRAAKHPKADYKGAKGVYSKYGEFAVILAEIVLLFGFSIPLWSKLANQFPDVKKSLVVRVVAEQFAWNFHYPGRDGIFGRSEPGLVDLQSNPLGLVRDDVNGKDDVVTKLWKMPVNKPVIAYLSSKDVVHSLGIPAMRVKQDAIPGQKIPVTFKPIKIGKYLIACSQLCGLGHSTMRGFIEVMEPVAFKLWYNKEIEDSLNAGAEEEAW